MILSAGLFEYCDVVGIKMPYGKLQVHALCEKVCSPWEYPKVIRLTSSGNLVGIDTFFNAKSVAIYGASTSPNSVGQAIVQNFLKPMYEGKVYAVNPKYTNVLGIPCFPTLQDIPDPVDMVVVAVPARITPRVFEDIAAKGVGAAIVVSGGFSETGPRGAELVEIGRKNGIRIIGPNCV